MLKDIENRDDVIVLVDEFYASVMTNPIIGYIFSEIVRVDWSLHLPKMYSFWETMLFNARTYTKNPYPPHYDVHQLSPLTEVEFNEWLTLFQQIVDELFEGRTAEKAKSKAKALAKVMLEKINSEESVAK